MNRILEKIENLFVLKIGIRPDVVDESTWKRALSERKSITGIELDEDYFKFLNTQPVEFQEFTELVIVPETWFFREKEMYAFIANRVKQLLKENKRLVRILSLPCSSGEEPYSILMSLIDHKIPLRNVVVDAMDISRKALAKAASGLYTENSFRGAAPGFKEDYFDKKGNEYKIKEELGRFVRFGYGNVMDTSFSTKFLRYDIVVCRYLLIYLHEDAQAKVFKLFDKLLDEKSILIVSAAEGEAARKCGYISKEYSKKFHYFVKKARSRVETALENLEDKVATLQYRNKHNESETEPATITEKEVGEEEILKKAQKMADLGSYDDATAICLECLDKYGVNSKVYFLLGLVQHAQSHYLQAEQFFQKAVYLEPTHYEALLYLALIAESRHDIKQAQLFRARAQRCFR